MATNYQRGRAFEYRVRNKLKDMGAVYVMRAAQSKGAADLIALFPAYDEGCRTEWIPKVWMVQAKRDGRLPKQERECLVLLGHHTGAQPVLAKTGPKGRGIEFVNLHE